MIEAEDLHQLALVTADDVSFACRFGGRRLLVLVSRETIEDTPPASPFSAERFEQCREMYADVAAELFSKHGSESGRIVVRSADVTRYLSRFKLS